MTTDYRTSSLWLSAFHSGELSAEQQSQRDRLLAAYNELQDHVTAMLARIPEDCRGLTVHDISHVHQLWDVASKICGPDYPINPLEGFILGAAFLIHDAGLTAAAYPGGSDELRRSVLYKDLLSTEIRRHNRSLNCANNSIDDATQGQKDRIFFIMLRHIHAERAVQLLDDAYIHPITRVRWTLVPSKLLFDVGVTIGRIAASHHWDINRVAREFGDPSSPLADFPGWQVDAFKLACILRCADACAIDERRAPIMAFIIENPAGVSRDHWMFQSLLKPGHVPTGQESLVFESKRPMKRENMDAWWLAYEAIDLADRELRDCDRLLKYRAGQRDHGPKISFNAKRISGAGDAVVLSQHVTVEGWRPVDAVVRVSNPSAIVELFGGRQLYGNDHTAPLRELIQNAADAVRAGRRRGRYDPKLKGQAGAISISIRNNEDGSWTVRVCDDGVGMPEEVLTGPFIEFGKSLWNSDGLAHLYPGLASDSEFKPTGRYGIGFYSSFMIGDDVKVMSVPFNGGANERRTLHFAKGIRGRAELRMYDHLLDGQWPFGASTAIEIRANSDKWFSEFASLSFSGFIERPILSTDKKFWECFVATLRQLVFSLDVRVTITCPYFTEEDVNVNNVIDSDPGDFIALCNRIFVRRGDPPVPEEVIPLVRRIADSTGSRGSVGTSPSSNGVFHIGGLTVFGLAPGKVIGVYEAESTTVSRHDPIMSASPHDLRLWAEDQLSIIDKIGLSEMNKATALLNIHGYGVDIKEKYFLQNLDGSLAYFDDLAYQAGDAIFLCCEKHHVVNRIDISFPQYVALLPRGSVKKSEDFRYVLTLHNHHYYPKYAGVKYFDTDYTSDLQAAVGQLLLRIRRNGFEPVLSPLQRLQIGSYIEAGIENNIFLPKDIKVGDAIYSTGVVITIDKGTTD